MRPKWKPIVLTEDDHAHLELLERHSKDQHDLLIEASKHDVNLSYEALAAWFGIPVGTVKSRLSRARDRLTMLRKQVAVEHTA
jgi:DNA-directed RNA polymerase specialized sigma24 family protein